MSTRNSFELHHGDCLTAMLFKADNSVDSIVTDPPYGLGFMGKHWDHGVPGVDFWAEMLRILKPGGHLLSFGGSRTYHRMASAVEDAGFEIRDQIMWVYGSGFPKSHNGEWGGTALKPAHEPIVVARKPLVGTVAANVLAHGTGALNIDGCRVDTTDDLNGGAYSNGAKDLSAATSYATGVNAGEFAQPTGRWPANLIHDGSAEVVAGFPATGKRAGGGRSNGDKFGGGYAPAGEDVVGYGDTGSAARFFYCAKASKADRDEGMTDAPDRVLAMSNQAKAQLARGVMHEGESGMNSAKVRKNNHPTVKPSDLMAYLCRLVTPPGGVVLDPFMGSGSTGKAAVREGFRFIGCDMQAEYVEIARARIAHELTKIGGAA